jgi:2-phosphosulfolactate phosphatase
MEENRSVEVLFTPTEFEALARKDLSETVCVVFDVLRATSTMVTALVSGADAILPVAEISEALEARRQDPNILLAGERDGVRIESILTGSIAFDLGNSPREFTKERVAGKKIVMTTTNGTRALRSCAHARKVLICSFLNFSATNSFVYRQAPSKLLLICSGTFEQAAFEDVVAAGAFCRDSPMPKLHLAAYSDSVAIASYLYTCVCSDLNLFLMSHSRNGRRLMKRPELKDDVAYCSQQNIFNLVAAMGKDGWIRKV